MNRAKRLWHPWKTVFVLVWTWKNPHRFMFCALGSQIMALFLKPLGACLTTKQSLGWIFVVLSMTAHPHPMLSISWSLPAFPPWWIEISLKLWAKVNLSSLKLLMDEYRHSNTITGTFSIFTKRDWETLKAEELRWSILSPCILGFYLPTYSEVSAAVIETRFYSLIMCFFFSRIYKEMALQS